MNGSVQDAEPRGHLLECCRISLNNNSFFVTDDEGAIDHDLEARFEDIAAKACILTENVLDHDAVFTLDDLHVRVEIGILKGVPHRLARGEEAEARIDAAGKTQLCAIAPGCYGLRRLHLECAVLSEIRRIPLRAAGEMLEVGHAVEATDHGMNVRRLNELDELLGREHNITVDHHHDIYGEVVEDLLVAAARRREAETAHAREVHHAALSETHDNLVASGIP